LRLKGTHLSPKILLEAGKQRKFAVFEAIVSPCFGQNFEIGSRPAEMDKILGFGYGQKIGNFIFRGYDLLVYYSSIVGGMQPFPFASYPVVI
jgi:hypothetical protein